MPTSTDRRIQAGFWLLTLVPLLLGIVAWQNTEQLVAALRDVARTNELVKKLEKFLSRVKDAEVAQREYVLTGDEVYVQELRTARLEVENLLTGLALPRADKHWLELLRVLVPEKFDEIQSTIDLRRAGDVAGASNTLLANRGGQSMDSIRRVVHAVILEESTLLDAQSTLRDKKLSNSIMLFMAFLLLNGVLIWSLFMMVRRESRQVHRHAAELEQQVQQRTVELRRSNDELQQFAYAASHDLKEPMRMISSYSALLERKFQGQLGADADTWIHFIVDGVQRMNSLITDLLSYSRSGQVSDDQKQDIDTEQLLTRVIGNLQTAIAETGAEVTHDALPVVCYGPVRMEQLLQNLIANALKYRSEAAPSIHISAREVHGEIVFDVRDNGIGIAPQYHDEIFGIFKRLHGKEVEGSGIGLATCKKIVEEHGGRIWVESLPGQGATFHFTVPLDKPAARAATS